MRFNTYKLYQLVLLSWITTLFATTTEAQDIFINPDADGNLSITWTIPPCIAPKPGWEDEFLVEQPFRLKFKKASALLWQETLHTSGSGAYIPASYLEPGYVYRFKVWYYGKDADCRGLQRVRTLGVEDFYYNTAIFNETQIIPGRSKKIHGVAFDKCLYPYTWPGGNLETVRVFHWDCYNEDIKAFLIEELPGNRVKMKNQMLDYCIVPTPAFPMDYALVGLEIGVASCGIPNASFVKDPAGAPEFKLINEVNGRCLTASDDPNGSMLYQGECSDQDQRQFFYFEDF